MIVIAMGAAEVGEEAVWEGVQEVLAVVAVEEMDHIKEAEAEIEMVVETKEKSGTEEDRL